MRQSCYQKLRVKCTERNINGSLCGGDHHRLLHGSGVAYCHHTEVKLSSAAHSSINNGKAEDHSLDNAVLLEIQYVPINGTNVIVFYENGQTASLCTHTFAEKAGIAGKTIDYYLKVLDHGWVKK